MAFVQAMIVMAWNIEGSGTFKSTFEGNNFKRILSIFITAAILRVIQGMYVKPANEMSSEELNQA